MAIEGCRPRTGSAARTRPPDWNWYSTGAHPRRTSGCRETPDKQDSRLRRYRSSSCCSCHRIGKDSTEEVAIPEIILTQPGTATKSRVRWFTDTWVSAEKRDVNVCAQPDVISQVPTNMVRIFINH